MVGASSTYAETSFDQRCGVGMEIGLKTRETAGKGHETATKYEVGDSANHPLPETIESKRSQQAEGVDRRSKSPSPGYLSRQKSDVPLRPSICPLWH